MSPLTESTRLTCKNYGTPAAIAGAAPTLDYRFALDRTELDAVTLTDKLTFTRAATCAFTNLGGNLQLAGANVPRFDHSPSTLQSLGLLVEEARTNLLLRSEELENAAWTKVGSTISANSIASPSGAITADTLVEDTSTGTHRCLITATIANTTIYTVSVYAKAAGRTHVRLSGGSGLAGEIIANLSNGTVASSSGATNPTVQSVGNGWYRVSFTTAASTGTTGQVQVQLVQGTSTTSYTGDGTSGIYLWGAQLEAGAFPTSYIPTTSATITCSETATVSLTGLPATRTLVEKPVGCATVAGDTLTLNTGYTAERVMVFPAALSGAQITAIRSAM